MIMSKIMKDSLEGLTKSVSIVGINLTITEDKENISLILLDPLVCNMQGTLDDEVYNEIKSISAPMIKDYVFNLDFDVFALQTYSDEALQLKIVGTGSDLENFLDEMIWRNLKHMYKLFDSKPKLKLKNEMLEANEKFINEYIKVVRDRVRKQDPLIFNRTKNSSVKVINTYVSDIEEDDENIIIN